MIVRSADRVTMHTDESTQEQIRTETERRLEYFVQHPEHIERRLRELDEEWDIERWLEANASVLALSGTLLGIFVNRKFLLIPCFVLPFLLQHALQDWCPPVPILRRKGVRTRREIDAEKYALKALRGDFAELTRDGEPIAEASAAWKAASS